MSCFFSAVGNRLLATVSLYRSEMTCVEIRTLSLPINSSHTRWNIKESEEEELAIFTAHKTWKRLPERTLRQGNCPTFLKCNHSDNFQGPRSPAQRYQWSSQRSRKPRPQYLNLWPWWCWKSYDEGCAGGRHHCKH